MITNTMADNDYDKALDNAIETVLTKTGIAIAGDAIARANRFVDTGRLRGSITWAVEDERSHPKSPATNSDKVSRPYRKWTLHIGSNVEYAEHVEYGTYKMAAQPYLRPAYMRHRPTVRRLLKKSVHEALRRGK